MAHFWQHEIVGRIDNAAGIALMFIGCSGEFAKVLTGCQEDDFFVVYK
jgi:hypothetical protein